MQVGQYYLSKKVLVGIALIVLVIAGLSLEESQDMIRQIINFLEEL